MSIVKTKKLKRLGLKSKTDIKEARRKIHAFLKNHPKCNKPYAYNNAACNLGVNEEFWLYGYKWQPLRTTTR